MAAGASSGSGSDGAGEGYSPLVGVELTEKLGVRSTAKGLYGIDVELHRENRERLVARLRKGCAAADSATSGDISTLASGEGVPAGSVVLLEGGKEPVRHATDHEPLFRQESFFGWAFGCRYPDCWGAIDVDSGKSVIFVPRLAPESAIWMGPLKSASELAAEMGIDEGRYVEEVGDWVRGAVGEGGKVLVLEGLNTDSGREMKGAEVPGGGVSVDKEVLYGVMAECRVFKSDREITLMRAAGLVTSEAHLMLMAGVQPGMREDQLEALYRFWAMFHGGMRHQSYTWICGSGPNAAILHYGHAGAPNDRVIGDGEFVLCDCGNELHLYATDVTTTFPSSGSFSPQQKVVYEAVLDAQNAVLKAMKPGTVWKDMQTLAYEKILTGLKAAGVVQGEVADMMEANLAGNVFMPHGLGHFLGIDTHDVGGYNPAGVERDSRPGYRSLRTTRILAPRMSITVEPGCYFIDSLLDAAFENPTLAPFLNKDLIDKEYRGIGGVRLEDNVVLTTDGIENFTKVPRTVEQVEKACKGEYKTIHDF